MCFLLIYVDHYLHFFSPQYYQEINIYRASVTLLHGRWQTFCLRTTNLSIVCRKYAIYCQKF